MHTHINRLSRIWIERPIYFITTCVKERRSILANQTAFTILRNEFYSAPARHGWHVGQFVIMPDHLHFFCVSEYASQKSSSQFVGALKEWSSKQLAQRLNCKMPLWQRGFFDHILRSSESYTAKWQYVLENPVRAGLTLKVDDWQYAGIIEDITMA